MLSVVGYDKYKYSNYMNVILRGITPQSFGTYTRNSVGVTVRLRYIDQYLYKELIGNVKWGLTCMRADTHLSRCNGTTEGVYAYVRIIYRI